MSGTRLRVDDFDYDLPPEAIAQVPAEPRDASRLLVLDRATGAIEHARFADIGRWLEAGDLLVVNDSRVLAGTAARDSAPGGGSAEVLLLRPTGDEPGGAWEALVRPSRRLVVGAEVTLPSGHRVEVGERLPDGMRLVQARRRSVRGHGRDGAMPLPPYIRDTLDPGRALPDGVRGSPGVGCRADGRPALHAGAARAARGRGVSHGRT